MNNSEESRRALYQRAREALITQLHGVAPALNESDITRERLALEQAIRSVESASSLPGAVPNSKLSVGAAAVHAATLLRPVPPPPAMRARELDLEDSQLVPPPPAMRARELDLEDPQLVPPPPAMPKRHLELEDDSSDLRHYLAKMPAREFRRPPTPPAFVVSQEDSEIEDLPRTAHPEMFVWRWRDARRAALLVTIPVILCAVWFALASGLGLAGLTRAWPLVLILAVAAVPLIVTLGLARQQAPEGPFRQPYLRKILYVI